jgi:hypothetical protein
MEERTSPDVDALGLADTHLAGQGQIFSIESKDFFSN